MSYRTGLKRGGREELPSWSCRRCGHKWIPRKADRPVVCPECKSPWWDKPKKEKKGGEV